ncbi:MAG: lipid A deacylase LpxR family protein [Deltaproteobacteria bacterium]|nr:lipid A deacylase LpxR family protein [Deltaproteobacteria bacterium]
MNRRNLITVLTSVLLWSLTLPAPVWASDPGHVVNLHFENDFFGGGTDRHFTHGTRIEFLTGPISWISNAADKLPWFRVKDNEQEPVKGLKGRAGISIGQNLYTPDNTCSPRIVEGQRPYAGWLYMGFGLVVNKGTKRYDKLQLEVGMVGPASLAEDIQTFWHSLFGLHVPEGWDNQLKNEPGFVLYYEQARRFARKSILPGLEVDIIPHFGGSLGNVFTYGAAGYIVRLGQDLKDDFGPPRIRPSLPGGGYFSSQEGFNWYLFAGMEGRIVLQNIFLDGNSFRESHSVDRKLLVGDIQAGIALQWKRFRASYTQIFRTREFKGQESDDIFGSLCLSYNF